MYYKKNCRARVTTFTGLDNVTTVRLVSDHSHDKIYGSQKSVELLFNYRWIKIFKILKLSREFLQKKSKKFFKFSNKFRRYLLGLVSATPRILQSSKGKPKMIYQGHSYFQNGKTSSRVYWLCSKNRLQKCNARIITTPELMILKENKKAHNHGPEDREGASMKEADFEGVKVEFR